jgi:hypothetical protein
MDLPLMLPTVVFVLYAEAIQYSSLDIFDGWGEIDFINALDFMFLTTSIKVSL